MNDNEWFDRVDEILETYDVKVDTSGAGWMFFFENGYSPEQAVEDMLGFSCE
jgi:hypothetical protein